MLGARFLTVGVIDKQEAKARMIHVVELEIAI